MTIESAITDGLNPRREPIGNRWVWASLVAIILLFSTALYVHRDAMFWHLDGYMVRQSAEGQFRYLDRSASLGLDPLRGPGSLYFPVNFRLLPVIAVQEALFGGEIAPVFTYLAYAVECTLVTLLLARYCGFSPAVGVASGLALVLLTMPVIWTERTGLMFPMFLLAPYIYDVLAFGVAFFVAFGQIGLGSWWRSALLSLACAGLMFWALAASPLWFLVLAPFMGTAVLAQMITADRAARIAKCAGIALVASVIYVAGAIDLLRAMSVAGPIGVFGFEMEAYQSGAWWSSLVHQYDTFPMGAVIAGGGTLVALIIGARALRRLPRGSGAAAALLTGTLGLGFVVAWKSLDVLALPIEQLQHVRLFYFELPLLPFYALFTVYGISIAFNRAALRWPQLGQVTLLAVVLSVVALMWPRLGSVRDFNPWPQPAMPTPITRLLEDTIGFAGNATFRGRVATLFASTNGDPASWDRVVAHDTARIRLQQNDHRLSGLWAFQIPTLQEYSQMLTPGTYFWITRAMSTHDDIQDMRSHAIMTRPDLPLMKLFGVRYVITPRPIADAGFELRAAAPSGDLLYEIDGANVGQYYAGEVRRVPDVSSMLREMGATNTLLDKTWVFEDLPADLSPGQASLALAPSGLRVTGRSAGTALVLLPYTFHRCYRQDVASGDRGARLVRANLNMLGLLFTESIDTTLTLKAGPASDSRCMLDEDRELASLGLARAAREFGRGSLAGSGSDRQEAIRGSD